MAMDKLLEIVANQLLIRGTIEEGRLLRLAFLTGWVGQGHSRFTDKTAFFNINCTLQYDEDDGTFWEDPRIQIAQYKDAVEMFYEIRHPWDVNGWELHTYPCVVSKGKFPNVHVFGNNHPQLLQTFTYLCSELRSASYITGKITLEGEVYVHLANRLVGFIQSRNRKYLRAMEIDSFK